MLALNDGRDELWQWDTGRTLAVYADCSQVHFSNKVFGRSIDVDVIDGTVKIPDFLLQTDKDLTAWAFYGSAENGYTKISKVFKVNKRNKPADYVFTPTDQTTLGEILDRIEDLENRPGEDISEEEIQNAVNDYLDKNPISVEEKDPTVPAWAKQPEKPKYTAEEVGALAAPSTASVGQTIVVKAVDETGKPTEWEAADLPSGGGSTFNLIVDMTTEEHLNVIDISTTDSGETIAEKQYTEAYISMFTPGNAEITSGEPSAHLTLWYGSDARGTYAISNAVALSNKWNGIYLKCCGNPFVLHFLQTGTFKSGGSTNLVYTGVPDMNEIPPYLSIEGFTIKQSSYGFPVGTKIRIFAR